MESLGAGIGPEFVNAPMTEAESEAIHLSIRRDCRCGTESGIRSTAAQMRLQPSLRSRGDQRRSDPEIT